MKNIYKIMHYGRAYAIVGRTSDAPTGLSFIGSEEEPIQVGILNYNKDTVLQNHIHKKRIRTIELTQECIYVVKGKVKVLLFDENKKQFEYVILKEGYFIVLYRGGHGFEILEDNTIMLECKPGNFTTVEEDKEKF